MSEAPHTDVLVVGGGMFGTFLATMAAGKGHRVKLIEKRNALFQAASLVNQARIHNGYHYPRSILTGLRSRENFERFRDDFPTAVMSDFEHLYAIARRGSQVTAQQFALFCDRIGAFCEPVPASLGGVFDSDAVEAVFRVKEHAFDPEMLRRTMEERMRRAGVEVHLGRRVVRLRQPHDQWPVEVTLDDGTRIRAAMVLQCTYADINGLLHASGSPLVRLKQELVEIALVRLPPSLARLGWTIMDGPFSSSLPFPARNARSLYHVRYSVHGWWNEGDGTPPPDSGPLEEGRHPMTHFRHMQCDGARYVPALADADHIGSLWTIRTKLPGSALTDSRPIMFRAATGMPRVHLVLGGKIDNVYDLEPFLDEALGQALGG